MSSFSLAPLPLGPLWAFYRRLHADLLHLSEQGLQEIGRRAELPNAERQALAMLWALARETSPRAFWARTEARAASDFADLPCYLPTKEFLKSQRQVAQAFAQAVAGKSVALVGPAAHLRGQAMGQEIDRLDLVVRLNYHWPVPPALRPDLGERADVLYHCCNGDFPIRGVLIPEFARLRFVVAELGVQSKAVFRYAAATGVKAMSGSEPFDELRQKMRANPTTGAFALHHLLSQDVGRVKVFGMSFLRSGYMPETPSRGGEGRLTPHDHEAELAYCRQRWFKDPRLSFDRISAGLVDARTSGS